MMRGDFFSESGSVWASGSGSGIKSLCLECDGDDVVPVIMAVVGDASSLAILRLWFGRAHIYGCIFTICKLDDTW